MEENPRSIQGKRILVVDDEPDVLDSLAELLDACQVDQAETYDQALELLDQQPYDAAILDIMGVSGYGLLEKTAERGIPTLMLTAHALSSDDFVQSIRGGAEAYVPKDRISDIAVFLADVMEAQHRGPGRKRKWLDRLDAFFEDKFGTYWREKVESEFWKKYFSI